MTRIINFIDEFLLKRAKDNEAFTFYYKMEGDFNKYIAEFEDGNLKIETKDSASKAYNEAIKRASKLHALNPIRRGLLLNYLVFQYEFLEDHKKAIEIAKNAINEIDTKLPNIDEDANENRF